MVRTKRTFFYILRLSILVAFLLGFTSIATLYGQDSADSTSELGNIAFPQNDSPLDHYIYDTEREVYVYVQSDGNYPLNTPLVLSPKECGSIYLMEY